VKLSIC